MTASSVRWLLLVPDPVLGQVVLTRNGTNVELLAPDRAAALAEKARLGYPHAADVQSVLQHEATQAAKSLHRRKPLAGRAKQKLFGGRVAGDAMSGARRCIRCGQCFAAPPDSYRQVCYRHTRKPSTPPNATSET